MRPVHTLALTASLAAVSLAACSADKRGDGSPRPGPGQSSAPTPPPSAAAPAAPTDAAKPASDAAKLDLAGADAYDAPAVKRLELPSGLIIEDLKVGTGMPALPKAVVTFHARAKIKDGEEFYNTQTVEGGPKPETASILQMFEGLSTGMVGVQAGGRRRLTIPGDLAPGIAGLRNEQGEVRIPADATLIYVVDVVEVKQQFKTTPDPAPAAAPASPPAPATPTKP